MKVKNYILLLFLFISILIFTNPSEGNHIQAVKLKLKMSLNKKPSSEIITEYESFNAIGRGFEMILGDVIIDRLTENFVSRENFIMFSLTKVNFKGEVKTIGFGILGNVFITNTIEEALNQNLKN